MVDLVTLMVNCEKLCLIWYVNNLKLLNEKWERIIFKCHQISSKFKFCLKRVTSQRLCTPSVIPPVTLKFLVEEKLTKITDDQSWSLSVRENSSRGKSWQWIVLMVREGPL